MVTLLNCLNSFVWGSGRKWANSRSLSAVSHATWVLSALTLGSVPCTAFSSQGLVPTASVSIFLLDHLIV